MSNRSVFHIGFLSCLLPCLSLLIGCGGTNTRDELAAHYPVKSISSSSNSSVAEAPSSGPLQQSAIRYDTIRSKALQTEMGFAIYLPAGYDPTQTDPAPTYPVLYIMYGYGGNQYSMFDNFMSVNLTADKMITAGAMKPMILVVPDYKNSFAVNSTRAQNPHASGGSIGLYEDYLIKELIPYIDTHFASDKTRAGRFIEGYSMGGFAALYLGFNYPQLFSKIGAHSSALWDYSSSDMFIGQRDWLYTTPELRAQRDPFLLAQSQDLAATSIYLDVGSYDALYSVNERFYNHLLHSGVRVEWHTSNGGHDRNYWGINTGNYFTFFDLP